MSRSWHGVYAQAGSADPVAEALGEALAASGYTAYDPFPGGGSFPSPAWKRLIRQFVAPPSEGWTRILGEPDPDTLPRAASILGMPLLYAHLTDSGAELEVWTAKGLSAEPEALALWLRVDRTLDDLRRALADEIGIAPGQESAPAVGGVPLPDDVRALADRVDPRQAEKLMGKLTRSLFGKVGGGESEAQARALIGGSGSPWETPGGSRLLAAAACLSLPRNWRDPSFEAVNDAYQVARARQRHPRGLCLPGDDEALALVPNALAYQIAFAGRIQ